MKNLSLLFLFFPLVMCIFLFSSCSKESMKNDYFVFENNVYSESSLSFHINDNEIQKRQGNDTCHGKIVKNDERSKYGVIVYNISFSNCSGGKDYKPYGSMPLLLYYPDHDIIKYVYVPDSRDYPVEIILYTQESYKRLKEIGEKYQEKMQKVRNKQRIKRQEEIEKRRKEQQEEMRKKQENSQIETINGIYSYEGREISLEITINGDSWYGKTMIITGFGSEYDNQQAKYESGIIRGNDLYESRGVVKIGYVRGNNLTTALGEKLVTLRKK